MSKALILAAGLGSRLKYITADRPKALTPVGGKPILDYQIRSVIANDIKDIAIVLGYHGELIQHFMQEEFPQIHIHYIWNREFATSNSSFSVWLARDWIQGESYIHLNCDIVFAPDLLQELIVSSHENIIAIKKDFTPNGKMEYVTLSKDRITKMAHIYSSECVAKAFGFAKFSKNSTQFLLNKIKQCIKYGDKNQHYFGIIHEAIKEIDYYSLDATNKPLFEINTLEDLTFTERNVHYLNL